MMSRDMNRKGRSRIWMIPVAALALFAGVSTSAAQQFALKDGETVVFYGDSITAQRLYTKDVEEFVLTRYPQLHIHFVNAGVPGDTASGGYTGTMAERVARDVAPYQPGMITVMLGMNDGGWGYGSPDQIAADFKTKYLALLGELRRAAPHAAVTLICPTPYDEITHGTEFPGYSHMVERLAGEVSQIGSQMQNSAEQPVFVVDFHGPMMNALQRAKADNPEIAPLFIPDRIHPAPAGHWIMAAALLSAWHADPIVSSVTLNAADAASTATERTKISDLRKSADGIAWTQLDEALPLPFDFNDAMTTEMLRISNVAAFDRQMLQVSSLEAGTYELSIDGKAIASFLRDDLQAGVNLALDKTPMLSQARDVASQEDRCAELDQARFVVASDVKPMPTSGIAEATLRAAQDELEASIRKDLAPAPHKFELRRVHEDSHDHSGEAH